MESETIVALVATLLGALAAILGSWIQSRSANAQLRLRLDHDNALERQRWARERALEHARGIAAIIEPNLDASLALVQACRDHDPFADDDGRVKRLRSFEAARRKLSIDAEAIASERGVSPVELEDRLLAKLLNEHDALLYEFALLLSMCDPVHRQQARVLMLKINGVAARTRRRLREIERDGLPV